MTVLFAGTEPEAFSFTTNVLWTTASSGANYDPDYSRGALSVARDTYATVEFASVGEVWVHARVRSSSGVGSSPVFIVRDSAGNPLVALQATGSAGGQYNSRYYTSATASTVILPLTPFSPSLAYFLTLRVKWVAVNQLLVEFYFDGSAISSATVTSTWIASKKPARVDFGGTTSSSSPTYISEVVIADEDPRGWRVSTLVPNGNGALGEWAGSYVDVDEIGPPDDNDFISSDTAGQVELFAMSNLSAPAQNLTPVAVFVSSRARVGAGGPQNIKPGLRTGGANFYGANITGLSAGFSNTKPQGWQTNPNTSSPWSVADIQNLEVGFQSVT